MSGYQPRRLEEKWKKKWEEHQIYKTSETIDKPKYYVLDMFPYPSGAGLHVGHPLGYIASDIVARYKRHQGYNVLHPMGYDAFGLPAEQYAIQTGVHPSISTANNIAGFRKQMDNIGFSYDWDREINTSDPSYYKWTQWIVTLLFGHYYDTLEKKAKPIEHLIHIFKTEGSFGVQAIHHLDKPFTAAQWNAASPKQQSDWLMCYRLLYRKEGFVNWCEALGTVLANDEVKDGVSERGGHPVVKKSMNQWYLRTTAYAERLLEGLENLDWPESLKIMQRNWIGKSFGAKIHFQIHRHPHSVEIFTTRPDTIFGVTFMVLAPEHELVDTITTQEQKAAVEHYKEAVSARSERDRLSDVKKISGVFTGAYAVHPLNQELVPIWIADYVLKDYGTGAIMAVPADDERDRAFAKHFHLPIIEVIDRSHLTDASLEGKEGILINSDFLNGMRIEEAIFKAIETIEERGLGRATVQYKLRDANFSRQRYWGEPFPIKYNAQGIPMAESEDNLPITLPELDDFKPTSDGKAPLNKATDWVYTKDGFFRETDTMPGFAGSSWYYIRYMDPTNNDVFCSQEKIHYWREVDFYIGGAEHAVGHLLYARTWHKFLYDLGFVPSVEPFKKLVNQGMIQGLSAFVKMSKSPISSFYYLKSGQWIKKDLHTRSHLFLSDSIIYPDPTLEFVRFHVPIDLVIDHGKNSHLDIHAVQKLIEIRPDWQNAVFVGDQGYFSIPSQDLENDNLKLQLSTEVEKMSKSKYNVVNPDQVIEKYGADCFRMYEMFLGPIEQSKPWDINGIDGVSKFLKKCWSLYQDSEGNSLIEDEQPTAEEMKVLHTLIKKIHEDMPTLSFNTSVAAFMIAVNELKKLSCHKRHILQNLAILLSPFAPFIAAEFWELCGQKDLINDVPFPVHDEKYLISDEVDYPICINGKKKSLLKLSKDITANQVNDIIEKHPMIPKWTENKPIKKVIFVPGKMINLVVS